MRKTIAIEGRDTVPGQFLEVGCLKWNEGEVYPLLWNFVFDGPPVGTVTNIRREDDGRVTAELTVTNEQALVLTENNEVSATFYASDVVAKMVKNMADEVVGQRYSSCRLRAFSLVLPSQVRW